MISKELLSEVLGLNVVYTESCEHRDGIIGIWTDINTKPIEEINIYKFAFKCKKWAENKGYIIFSKNKECLIYSIDEVYDVIECLNQYEDYFEADTECEAIFKACEWILKNKAND